MTQTEPERAVAPARTSTPTGGDPARRPRSIAAEGGATLHLFGRFGLPMLLVVVIAVFSFWRPDSFFAWANFNATFAQQAIIVMVAFGAMVPLIVGEFDLSIGANAGFSAILTVGLGELQGLPAWLSILVAVLASAVIGLLNGLIVTRLRVNSFVATLGTSTALLGIGQLYTDQRDIQNAPADLLAVGRATFAGLPITVVVALVAAVVLAVALQLLPIGRQLLAVGANRKAAELTGIRPELRIVTAFVLGGVVAGIGGALYGANLGAAGNQTGATLLLPAFAGAFLGSTTITPGRYNVLGTLVAVLLLAFTVSGLEQVGVAPWIEAVVQGIALIAAVTFSSWAIRRRTQLMRNAQLALLAAQDPAHDARAGTAAPTDKEQP